jgi:hypothetical protein
MNAIPCYTPKCTHTHTQEAALTIQAISTALQQPEPAPAPGGVGVGEETTGNSATAAVVPPGRRGRRTSRRATSIAEPVVPTTKAVDVDMAAATVNAVAPTTTTARRSGGRRTSRVSTTLSSSPSDNVQPLTDEAALTAAATPSDVAGNAPPQRGSGSPVSVGPTPNPDDEPAAPAVAAAAADTPTPAVPHPRPRLRRSSRKTSAMEPHAIAAAVQNCGSSAGEAAAVDGADHTSESRKAAATAVPRRVRRSSRRTSTLAEEAPINLPAAEELPASPMQPQQTAAGAVPSSPCPPVSLPFPLFTHPACVFLSLPLILLILSTSENSSHKSFTPVYDLVMIRGHQDRRRTGARADCSAAACSSAG